MLNIPCFGHEKRVENMHLSEYSLQENSDRQTDVDRKFQLDKYNALNWTTIMFAVFFTSIKIKSVIFRQWIRCVNIPYKKIVIDRRTLIGIFQLGNCNAPLWTMTMFPVFFIHTKIRSVTFRQWIVFFCWWLSGQLDKSFAFTSLCKYSNGVGIDDWSEQAESGKLCLG